MAPLVIQEEMSEQYLVGMDQDPVPTCKAFVRSVVVLFLALYHVYFDSPAEIDVVRRFHTSAKVFLSASAGTQTRDLSHSNCNLSR